MPQAARCPDAVPSQSASIASMFRGYHVPAQTIAPLPDAPPTVLGWAGAHPVLAVIVLFLIVESVKALRTHVVKLSPLEVTVIVRRGPDVQRKD